MIMIICDTHCYYDIINRQVEYAETTLGCAVSSIIHLGDFGVFRSHLNDFFIKRKKRFMRPFYFIDGNHEDFDALPWLVKKYADFVTYLPRSSVHTIDGYRFLALGGAAYMDSMITERGAVITDQQIDACLSVPPGDVDIILTHDCPVGIGVPNTPGMGHFGVPGFPRSDELVHHFKPRLWLFGHHHKWYLYNNDHTSFYGLCGAWKGFGLLDKDYTFSIEKHKIDWEKTSLLEKLLVKLKIIRPDSPTN